MYGYDHSKEEVGGKLTVHGSRVQGQGKIGINIQKHLDALPKSSKTMTIEVGYDGDSMRYTGDLGEMYFVPGFTFYEVESAFADTPVPSKQDVVAFIAAGSVPPLLPSKK